MKHVTRSGRHGWACNFVSLIEGWPSRPRSAGSAARSQIARACDLSQWRWCVGNFAFHALFLGALTSLSFPQNSLNPAGSAPSPKHFDHVLIVVLENQNYNSAIRNDLLKSIALKGAIFSNFGNLYHYSYPNYLAMVAGSDFGVHKPLLFSDKQRNFDDDNEHKTIADLLNWRDYAEDYPASPADQKPFLAARKGRYARKHVPFLSFREVQNKSFHNVVAVDTHAPDNAFVTDIGRFIADPPKYPLPEYIFYSPNLDDDGHDPTSDPREGIKKTTEWLRVFLTTWLHFDDKSWVPKDEALKRMLVVVTFDESEGNTKPERIYTVFLGAMVKPQEVTTAYDHYSVLRTIEDNFGVGPIRKDSGDGTAPVITGIWK